MIHSTIHSAGGAAGEFVSSPPGSRSAAKTITAGTVKVQNAESYCMCGHLRENLMLPRGSSVHF